MARYKYATLIQTLQLPPEVDALAGDAISRHLAEHIGAIDIKVGNAIDRLPDGEWEAVSQDLTRFGDSLVVSFLVRSRK